MISFLISAIKIIFLLSFLIFIHEGGHFLIAKLSKVKVNEFSIGFGPILLKKQGKETKYTIRIIPLGGFVSMEGEDEESNDEHSFSKASISKRIAICLAGATVNIIFGMIVYFSLAFSSGPYISNQIESIIEGSVAQKVGIQPGDEILEINGEKINNKYDLNKILQKTKDKEVNIKLKRNEENIELKVIPTKVKSDIDENTFYYQLGVNMKLAEDNFNNRIIKANIETTQFLGSTLENLKQLVTQKMNINNIMGPVGISSTIAKTNGIREFVYLMALISISLGITNLLPIPALDGGRILILIIEAIRRKPMKKQTEMNIQLLGFSFLIVFSLFIAYNDMTKIIN